MRSINDIKKGAIIQLDGAPYRVAEYDHSSHGRGSAVIRTKLRNLEDGSVTSKTFRGSDKVESAHITPVTAQFLYSDTEQAYFMRTDTYEQVGVDRGIFGNDLGLIPEGLAISLLYHGERPITYELPTKVDLHVTEAEPGVRGNSAGNVTKSCTVETGKQLHVPLFVEAGDTIRVDTRSGDYLERL